MGPAEDDLAAVGGATLGDVGAMLAIAAWTDYMIRDVALPTGEVAS